MADVHDHFDGSYRCVNCKGPCKLTGDSLTITQLVRMLMERYAISGWEELPQYDLDVLKESGVPVVEFWRRAKATLNGLCDINSEAGKC